MVANRPAGLPEAGGLEGARVTKAPIDIASLLCSRLCHDLLSPVGAMNNGLELLADESDAAMRARCIDLLGDSARAAAGKLKFFRLAFGAGGGFGTMVDTHDAREAVDGLLAATGRTRLDWQVADAALPKLLVKLLLNAVLTAHEALVRGGELTVGAELPDDGYEVVVRAAGPRIILDPVIRAALLGQLAPHEVDSRTAVAWLVRDLAASAGGDVQIAEAGDVLMIGLRLPR
jgi:histidine phosphotransferase ChpT